jgi:prepilin-type N-terminal cleavage/methylation domain-containing protein
LRSRRLTGEDAGFTLVEILVAITLLAIAAGGAVPLLIIGMKAAATSRFNTQAKNLAQQRFESMRDLQFHVDRQNGPFVDLLDIYYTNLTTTPTTRTRAGETEVGKWVNVATPSPAPARPFYQVSIASLPGSPGFSQTIYTQFLNAAGNVMPSTTFTSYNSQSEGNDQPPALMVGVTLVTTWADHGVSHSYTAYTRISDSRGLVSSVASQGTAEFLRLSSTGLTGNALTVDLAKADASGGQSTGSAAAAQIRAFEAVDSIGTDYLGATGVATSPNGSTNQNSPVGVIPANSGTCGWVGVGPSQVSDLTATTAGGLPKVPSDVDTNSPPTHQVAAQVTSSGNGPCEIFGFSNQSTSYSSNLRLSNNVPLVRIRNDPGNLVVVSGSAWVNATSGNSLTHSVTAGANTYSTKRLQLFPGADFVADGAGVVDINLQSASIACSSAVSNGSVNQSATGSWRVTIDYWRATDTAGHGERVTLPQFTWNSASDSGSADPLAALDPTGIVTYANGGTTLKLSDYISSWNTARTITENPNSGVHHLDGIVSVTTQAVRQDDIISALGLQLGNVSCVADDNR